MQAKDAGTSFALEHWLARELADFGELKEFKLNSRDRTIRVEILLKGEPEIISVTVTEYELLDAGEEASVIIHHAWASREWLTMMLRRFLVGKPYPLPKQHLGLIRAVLKG